MLLLKIEGKEYFDDVNEVFVYPESFVLKLEHSLASLSKWEQKFEKPFLDQKQKTPEEILYYVEMMILNDEYPEDLLYKLTDDHIEQINNYIDAKMTATWFNDATPQAPSREVITAELIYYWLFALEMPLELETWHLNRLFTQIKVVNLKQQKPKKMGRASAAAERQRLNAERRAAMGTTG